MNQETNNVTESIIQDKPRKPIHHTIVSIGAFLMISSIFLLLMDMLFGFIAGELGVTHAGLGELYTDPMVSLYATTIRSVSLACIAFSIILGFIGPKLYLHRLGRYMQTILKLMVSFLISIMFGLGIGALLLFALFSMSIISQPAS